MLSLKNLLVLAGFLLVLFSSFVVTTNAQGVIVPIICERAPRCQPPPRPIIVPLQLPIKSIKIDTRINAQVATTHVEQIFRNDTDATLEGTYFFPIPETASISEFAIWEGDKRLVGEVRSREEARRIYESIVRRQRDPGLLEYAGKDLFQATIFPIPPRSDKKLEITYTQVLKAENGTVAYRYPLGTGNTAWVNTPTPPRPIPVRREEDSLRNRPNAPRIGTVSGRIEIESRDGIRNVYSPSHEIDVRKSGETRATLSFESTGNKAQQDFQLFYGVTRDDFGLSLLTYREPGKDGYFLLTLSPKDAISEREFSAKDIVFVVDTSGSMADEGKIEKARAALLFGIRGLRDSDKFNVVSFAGEERLMESGLINADARGRARGEEFVKNLKATGGTNINDSLRAAIRQFNSNDRPKMLVFMTDGLPTVGETRVERIVENLKENLRGAEGLRIFTFGVGYDVNTQLLDKIASENGGVSDYVEPKENLEVKVGNFFSKVSSPVLTDIEIDWGGISPDLVYPRKMPDLFKGTQITLIGRYQNSLEGVTLTMRGKTGRETRTFNYSNLNFPNRAESNEFLPRLWASRRVGWLLEQIRSNGEQKELRDEIVELGTRYGIVTPYTSYLATDGSERREDLPRGTTFSSVLRSGATPRDKNKSAAPRPTPKVEAQSGADAVMLSKQQNAQQANVMATAKEDDESVYLSANVARNVGTKTFYNQTNNIWQDAEFKQESNLPEVTVKFASEDYFNLLKQEKELAQYFALGEEVVVVFKGKVYRVVK
ncbi:MAG: VIT and VWA domain-containing protein [Pyrinomonadaceae bacterium]